MGNSPPKKLVLQSWQNHLKAESCQCHVWLQECMYLNIHRQWKFSSREPCSFVSFFYVLCLKNLSCAGCARKVQWSPVQRPSMCMQHTHSPGIYLFCTKILVEADVSSSLPCTACFSRLHKKAAEKFIKKTSENLGETKLLFPIRAIWRYPPFGDKPKIILMVYIPTQCSYELYNHTKN